MSDLVYFSFSQLFKHGVHLGLQSTLLHSSMLKYLLPLNYLNFTLFNLNFAYVSLRLVSNFIVTMSSMRKPSLVINSVSFLDDFLVDFFAGLNQPVARGLWVSGRLTNFRFVRQSSVRRFYLHKIIIKAFARIESMGLSNSSIRNVMNRTFNPIRYKQSVFRHVMNLTRMPRFCFINDSVINSVSVNECFILNIPSICSVDSGSFNISYVTYPIPGNSVSLASVLLYYSIHKYSIQRGIYKERYLFILNSIKTKLRLNSILKRPFSSYNSTLKVRLPFLKVKVKLDILTSSLLQLFSTYNLSNLYNYFFTRNLVNFKKSSKKYFLTIKSLNLYTQYLVFKQLRPANLYLNLNSKLYDFLLLPYYSGNNKSIDKVLKFLKSGDLFIASLFSGIILKLNNSNVDIKCYIPNLFQSNSTTKEFFEKFNKFKVLLKQFKNINSSLFNFLYFNNKLTKDIQLILSTVDVFNTNFVTIYRKLFLYQNKLNIFSYKRLYLNYKLKQYNSYVPYITPVNVLLLWLALYSKFYKTIPLKTLLVSCYLPNSIKLKLPPKKSLYIHLIFSYSYYLFYKTWSLNYKHVKPFILSFFRLRVPYKKHYNKKISNKKIFTFKRSRRW